jgi:hypothetical protein
MARFRVWADAWGKEPVSRLATSGLTVEAQSGTGKIVVELHAQSIPGSGSYDHVTITYKQHEGTGPKTPVTIYDGPMAGITQEAGR